MSFEKEVSIMVRIAVCDDENNICSQIEKYILLLCKKLCVQFEVEVYYTGEGLCEKLADGICYDLIFLDIELTNMNGLEVGNNIRDVYDDEITQIVYISGKSEYALELFDINPLNFLVKPLSYEKIEKVINKYLKINDIQAGIFSYKYGHDTFQIMIKDIIYLKSKGKKIIIKLKNKEVDFYGSLEKVFHTQLKMYGFLFIHKSFVVNYSYVSIFEYERVILSDNTVLSIGQSKRKEIRKIQNELEIRRS